MEGVERKGGKGERRGKGREGKGHSPPRKKFLAPPLVWHATWRVHSASGHSRSHESEQTIEVIKNTKQLSE